MPPADPLPELRAAIGRLLVLAMSVVFVCGVAFAWFACEADQDLRGGVAMPPA